MLGFSAVSEEYLSEIPAITAAGGYEDKKKYIINKNGQLLVFKTKHEALALLNEETSPIDEIKALIDIDVSEKAEVQPQAVETASMYDINAMLEALRDNAQAEQLLNQQKYQHLIAMYEDYMDEQDIELLLMAA